MPVSQCQRCPRLVAFRQENINRWQNEGWYNAPVPSFGPCSAHALLVGLAPGLRGANCTGRPFTGDYAGDLLYPTLKEFGLAHGDYAARPDDGFQLDGVRITNAVRCVPPQNKPTPAEFTQCLPYLKDEIANLPNLRGLFAIGGDAHRAILTALELRKASYPFAHGATHRLPSGLVLIDSYHCSRYNTNTGRLTPAMFRQVVSLLRDIVKASQWP